MKESRFINQNKEKWLESEALLSNPVKDPEKLTNLFTQVVDDLSYSKTYYPNRSVRVYLNKIAQQYFAIIYGHKTERKNQFRLFWMDELPQVIIFCRKQLLLSLIVFLAAVAIGIFSAYNDPEFVSTILGKSYVEMTQENIKNGDPMAVYKKGHQVDMFLGISLNNLMVAFRTYVFGIFMGIGSLGILLYNGIMVGCFQFYFIQQGLFLESASSIWLHGTLEISAIIIAGGAGLTLGTGLMFPGTYSRLQAFQVSAIRSLKLMIGVSPIIVLAAIIESFLTRYSNAPAAVKLFLIVVSAVFIIGYFIVYPWMKSRSGFEVPMKTIRISAQSKEKISFTRIKNSGEILKDTFLFYGRYAGKFLPWVTTVSIVASLYAVFWREETITIITDNWFASLMSDIVYAMKTEDITDLLINSVCTSLVLYRVMALINAQAEKREFVFRYMSYVQTLIVCGIIYGAILLGALGILALIIVFGCLLLAVFAAIADRSDIFSAFARVMSRSNGRAMIEIQVILLILLFSFLLVLSAPLLYMYTSILEWNFTEADAWSGILIHFIEIFAKTLTFYLILPVLAASFAFLFYSIDETVTASELRKAIDNIGSKISRHAR